MSLTGSLREVKSRPFSCSCAVCFPHFVCQDTLLFASLFDLEVRVPQDWVAAPGIYPQRVPGIRGHGREQAAPTHRGTRMVHLRPRLHPSPRPVAPGGACSGLTRAPASRSRNPLTARVPVGARLAWSRCAGQLPPRPTARSAGWACCRRCRTALRLAAPPQLRPMARSPPSRSA